MSLLADVVEASRLVGETSSRLAKLAHLSALLRNVQPDEITIAVSYLSGSLSQGRIGLGYAAIRDATPDHTADTPSLTLREVDDAFQRIAETSGAGSVRIRSQLLHEMLARATSPEQQFLTRLVYGELRQGALEGIMLDAIARASEIPLAQIRRAFLLTGDVSAVAHAALTGGLAALSSFGVQLFRPLQPMLAQSADDVGEALARVGTGALEWKLDGARVQVHKSGDDVRVYTRNLNDVSESAPELVEVVRALPARELILDGETIVLRPNGSPETFQNTMRRFGRKLNVAKIREEMPLRPYFFDILYIDGETLIDRAGTDRFAALGDALPREMLMPRIVTGDVGEAEAFLQASLSAGHEGLVVKSLDAAYDVGRRGTGWLKVKVATTLDLVILAAEWGHGRRKGRLSNLHLGARDPDHAGFVMLGKTFKGLTDEMLEWQTRELLAREIARDDWTVYVRPELVAEIAFDDVQASPRYPGGVALRFARVKRYRPDKRAVDADTIATVLDIHRRQTA
jgi:DNA ligase 1